MILFPELQNCAGVNRVPPSKKALKRLKVVKAVELEPLNKEALGIEGKLIQANVIEVAKAGLHRIPALTIQLHEADQLRDMPWRRQRDAIQAVRGGTWEECRFQIMLSYVNNNKN